MIAGIDLSSKAIDCALIDEDTGQLEALYRWALTATGDAFDRTRWVRDSMPSRGWWTDQGVIAIGIEDPAGNHGVRAIARVQGGILQCLPLTVVVHPLPPSRWRKLIGLPGNASKDDVFEWANDQHPVPTQDAADALGIAHATRELLEVA